MTHPHPWGKHVLGRALAVVGVLAAGALLGANAPSLWEGFSYLHQMLTYDPIAVQSIDPAGPYATCLALADQTNAERHDTLVATLTDLGLDPIPVPVPESDLPNLFVPLVPEGPYVVLDAHYDKSRETPTYQGAADNTAAVGVLLAAAGDLAGMSPHPPVALLFSAAEERGMLGAQAFGDWAAKGNADISGIVVFDTLGRGRLAIRPTGWSGLRFWLPGPGHKVYDGRSIGEAGPLLPPDRTLTRELRALAEDDLIVYRRMAAMTNAHAFAEASIPAVAITCSDIYYLNQVWERDADRVELLDERNLAMAHRLIVAYARSLLRAPGS